MKNNEEQPFCFGDMESVFPMGENGLRHSPETCMICIYKTQCLRAAMKGQKGLKVQDEKIDRAYESGTMSFFERWSRKKHLHKMADKK